MVAQPILPLRNATSPPSIKTARDSGLRLVRAVMTSSLPVHAGLILRTGSRSWFQVMIMYAMRNVKKGGGVYCFLLVSISTMKINIETDVHMLAQPSSP